MAAMGKTRQTKGRNNRKALTRSPNMDESTSEVAPLIEQIPDDLFDLWRNGPLMLASRASLPVVELSHRMLTLRWGTDVIEADVEHYNFRWGRP